MQDVQCIGVLANEQALDVLRLKPESRAAHSQICIPAANHIIASASITVDQ